MKRRYIQPITELTNINLCGSILQDPGMPGDNGSIEFYATTIDANQGGFDEDDAWDLPSNSSIWDD